VNSNRTMNYAERAVYNEAQALYKKAQQTRDRAYSMQNSRVLEESQAAKKLAEVKKEAEVQAFSTKINNLCLALGEAAKKESLTIDGGPDSMWGIDAKGIKIFTVRNTGYPSMIADVYAVARKGFRWEIKS
jgi:hypothetical protein